MIIFWKYDKSHDHYTITNCNKGPHTIPRTKISQLKTKLESQRSNKPPSGIPKSSVSSLLDSLPWFKTGPWILKSERQN